MDFFKKVTETVTNNVPNLPIPSRDDLRVAAIDKFGDMATDAKNADKVGSLVKLFGKAATASDLTRKYNPEQIADFCRTFVSMSGLVKKDKASLQSKDGPIVVRFGYTPFKTIFGKQINLPAVPLKATFVFADTLLPEISTAAVALDL